MRQQPQTDCPKSGTSGFNPGRRQISTENMISDNDRKYILNHAYVPEHSVELITRISGGEPFLFSDYFCCHKNDWLIVVGYPLKGDFTLEGFVNVFEKMKAQFRPKQVSLMAPELPHSITSNCQERQSDEFYTLNLQQFKLKGALKRIVNKAHQHLSVERANSIGVAHDELAQEFIKRIDPPRRIRELFYRMPQYVSPQSHSFVLNAWDDANNLAAYYIVDLAAKNFTTYVVGCHSKTNYTPGASDLLCYQMIKLSQELGKQYIHLGIGVNEGITRFKKKWGGRPAIKYEMCELVLKKPSVLETIFSLR